MGRAECAAALVYWSGPPARGPLGVIPAKAGTHLAAGAGFELGRGLRGDDTAVGRAQRITETYRGTEYAAHAVRVVTSVTSTYRMIRSRRLSVRGPSKAKAMHSTGFGPKQR